MTWKHHLYRLNGDGTETRLHGSLPFSGPKFERELSGPGSFTASITPEQQGLRSAEGLPLFVPWSTAIFSEKDGEIRNGAILTNVREAGPALSIEAVGFTGYASGQPFTSEYAAVNEDPLNIVRMIWAHLQGKPGGNLGLLPDPTTSNMRVGKPGEEQSGSGAEGPFVLGWWQTSDLAKEIDDLAASTPFDYTVEHEWDGEQIVHRLRLGAPALGTRRHDLRFVVGENVFVAPEIDYAGDDYADEVLLLGAGDGRKMIRGLQQRPRSGRLRRTAVVEDKSITDTSAADRAALTELNYRLGTADISTITISGDAVGTYDLGDEIRVHARGGWHDGLDLWVRVLAISTDTETDTDELTIIRSEKAA